jgi:hypothetical protein
MATEETHALTYAILALILLSSLGAKIFMENIIGWHYPLNTLFTTLSYLITIVFLITIMTSFLVFVRIKNIPIAKLLSEIEV